MPGREPLPHFEEQPQDIPLKNIEGIEDSNKQLLWDKTRKEVDEIVDGLGFGIDEGIKDSVVAFMVNGFPTNASCEGHADRALPVPWIQIKALNKPKERFIGEEEVFKKVAQKYNVSLEELQRGDPDEAYWEALKESSDNDETEDYLNWEKENKKLENKAQELLDEFYKNRKVKPNIRLKVDKRTGCFRIHNGGKDYNELVGHGEQVPEEKKEKRAQKLAQYKKEMDEFTEFLKKKFFEEL